MPNPEGPKPSLPAGELQRLLVLVEAIQTDVRRVAEGHSVLEGQLTQFRQELTDPINGLGSQMKLGFREVFQRLGAVEQELGQVKQAVLESAKRLQVHEQTHAR